MLFTFIQRTLTRFMISKGEYKEKCVILNTLNNPMVELLSRAHHRAGYSNNALFALRPNFFKPS
jgi:hypothetical protein